MVRCRRRLPGRLRAAADDKPRGRGWLSITAAQRDGDFRVPRGARTDIPVPGPRTTSRWRRRARTDPRASACTCCHRARTRGRRSRRSPAQCACRARRPRSLALPRRGCSRARPPESSRPCRPATRRPRLGRETAAAAPVSIPLNDPTCPPAGPRARAWPPDPQLTPVAVQARPCAWYWPPGTAGTAPRSVTRRPLPLHVPSAL